MKILYSPGYGGGWTANLSVSLEAERFVLTYAPLIAAVEAGHDVGFDWDVEGHCVPGSPLAQFMADFTARFPQEAKYMRPSSGADDLAVMEVNEPFRITEYDGSEYVELLSQMHFHDPATF